MKRKKKELESFRQDGSGEEVVGGGCLMYLNRACGLYIRYWVTAAKTISPEHV